MAHGQLLRTTVWFIFLNGANSYCYISGLWKTIIVYIRDFVSISFNIFWKLWLYAKCSIKVWSEKSVQTTTLGSLPVLVYLWFLCCIR
jgi:hypothetical protein